jgi:uncharacterized protein (TIGR02147 family)
MDWYKEPYQDYRDALKDWFWYTKEIQKKLSFRLVSLKLGLKSPNHFHLVISKKRHLSKKLFDKALRLAKTSDRERQYLNILFDFTLEEDAAKKVVYRQQVLQTRKFFQQDDLSSQRYPILAHSLAWNIHAAAPVLQGKSLNAAKSIIKSSAQFAVTNEQIEDAIDLLIKMKLASIDNDLLEFDRADLKTKLKMESSEVKAHHKDTLHRALEAISWPVDKRFFSSITIPCNEELKDEFVSELQKLYVKFLERSRETIEDQTNCDSVATLQVSLVPFFNFQKSR